MSLVSSSFILLSASICVSYIVSSLLYQSCSQIHIGIVRFLCLKVMFLIGAKPWSLSAFHGYGFHSHKIYKKWPSFGRLIYLNTVVLFGEGGLGVLRLKHCRRWFRVALGASREKEMIWVMRISKRLELILRTSFL